MTTQTEVSPFVWDRDYKNTEQVRPYMADFLTIYRDIEGTKYNALFKGQIPGLANSAHEDTGIYLLQTLADLDRLKETIEAFLSAGGYRLSDKLPGPTERGTLVHVGFCMKGTGWAKTENVIVTVDERNRVLCKAPRQRNWRTHHDGPSAYLFMPT